jgi:signal transduction histidine kinase
MSGLRRFIALDGIAAQIVLLLVSAVLVTAVVSAFSFRLMQRPGFGPPGPHESAIQIGTAVRALDASSPEARPQLARALRSPEFSVTFPNEVPPEDPSPMARDMEAMVRRELPAGVRVLASRELPPDAFEVALSLNDHGLVSFRVVPREPPPPQPIPSWLLSLVISLVLVSFWAMRRLVTPLERFASAVRRFEGEGRSEPLAEEGPAEIRSVAHAFNEMRERIRSLVENRTHMLVAISHDLRTPLTRLRLRLEDLPRDEQRRRLLEDIALMDELISSALAYLREAASSEPAQMTDLPSIVETICEQFADTGCPVSYEGPRQLSMVCRPMSLGRAVTNLVENAVKFGTSVAVRVRPDGDDRVRIEVEDDGPGISDAEKQRVVEPFYRSDQARRDATGFGVGLTIVQSAATAHGGTFSLHDRVPRGLCARLDLPRGSAEAGRSGP